MIRVLIQARMSSSRLPGKVLEPVLGRPMLEMMLERVLRSREVGSTMVVTSVDPSDDPIEALCVRLLVECFRGSLDDVLDRYYQALGAFPSDHVVRVTGDCPLIDHRIIDATVAKHLAEGFDYTSTALHPTFPDGMDVEVMTAEALRIAWAEARLGSERGHVTPFIKKHPERFRLGELRSEVDLSELRFTVDEPEDLQLVRTVFEALYPTNPDFSLDDILEFLGDNPEVCHLNAHIGRDEGYQKSLLADKLANLRKEK